MYIRSSKNTKRNRRVMANEDVVDQNVTIEPEATELVFEAEDVAQLIAEVTEEDVIVEADENAVTFSVGDTDYTVEAEGQEEILEATSRVFKGKSAVKANRSVSRRPVSASSRTAGRRTVRRTTR